MIFLFDTAWQLSVSPTTLSSPFWGPSASNATIDRFHSLDCPMRKIGLCNETRVFLLFQRLSFWRYQVLNPIVAQFDFRGLSNISDMLFLKLVIVSFHLKRIIGKKDASLVSAFPLTEVQFLMRKNQNYLCFCV